MFETVDLFNVFGIKEEEKEKTGKKNAEKGKRKSEPLKKTEEKSVGVYLSPFTVYTGCYDPFQVASEDGPMTREKILELVQEKHAEYTKKLAVFEELDQHSGIVGFASAHAVQKGVLKLTARTVLSYGGYVFDLSSVMTDVECEVDIQELQKLVYEKANVFGMEPGFYVDSDAEQLVPRFIPGNREAEGFPVNVAVAGRNIVKISLEEYAGFLKNGTDETGIARKDKDGKLLPERTVIKRMIVEKFPEFVNGIIGYVQTKGFYSIFLEVSEKGSTEKAATTGSSKEKKEEMYPTKGVTLSLIYKSYTLSPEMFSGKEQVTKKELIQFLSSMHPEYSAERTYLDYRKAEKVIIPILQGSRKGANPIDQEQNMPCYREYELKFPVQDGIRYRSETLPFAHFVVPLDGMDLSCHGHADLYIPKIPKEIFHKAAAFFCYIADKYDAEAVLHVFWNRRKQRYYLYCPVQYCSYAALDCIRDFERERKDDLVLELHSHGMICSSFSATDNKDEMGTRFYGVFYDLSDTGFQFDLRGGCGGVHFAMEVEELFAPIGDDETKWKKSDFFKWEKRVFV